MMGVFDDNNLELQQQRAIEAKSELLLLDLMRAKLGDLQEGQQKTFDRLRARIEERLQAAETKADDIKYRLKWLYWRDEMITKKDGTRWCLRAGYTKNADKDGYYHWTAEIFQVKNIGGFEVGMSKQVGGEKFTGQFKKRNSCREAAWRKLEALGKKHRPKKRQSRKKGEAA